MKRTLESDDSVFRSALASLDASSPSARALTVYLAVKSVSSGASTFSLTELSIETTLRKIYIELKE